MINPLVLAAAKLGGVDEIYRVGGAQAVAALAYGTQTIEPVSKIVGPGNAYVAAAKRQVFGKVGIDMIAGPSEVLVLADGSANADWIAADLLAQAEHDEAAQSILITNDARLADDVEAAVDGQLKTLPRAQIAGASWRDYGATILVRDLDEALPLVDALAPEHLELIAADAESADRKDPQCGGDLRRLLYAGSDRRLCRRLEPCAADGALGALFVGARRARFRQAHLDPEMRAGSACGARTCGDRARRGGGARRACALGRDPVEPTMTDDAPSASKLVAVTLDEELIGRSGPDIEHERAVAIYDLIEENSFQPVDHPAGPYALHLSAWRKTGWSSISASPTARRWWRICFR